MRFKFLLLILLGALCLTLMLSCGIFTGDEDDNTGGGAFDGRFSQIVACQDIDITRLRSAVVEGQGAIPTVEPSAEQKPHELIIGDTPRAATAAAKAEFLKRMSEESAEYGYILYFDGDSVALYWNDDSLAGFAISDFLDICIARMNLELKDAGVIAMKFFKEKEMKTEAVWSRIKAVASDELYNALRRFATGFDGTATCEWMANLWDGDNGGFYYSNSARDNEPFRPDLESTYQVISWLKANGATSDVNALLPNEIKMKIVAFAKNMQYPDGYFYHPQWAKGTDKLQTDRYGRDLSWATDLISRFTVDTDGDGVEEKQYPNYCAPSGLKCKEHSENGGACGSAIPVALRKNTSSVQAAVSKVTASAAKPVSSVLEKPDYSSPEAFVSWLERMNADIKNKPGLPSHYICALQHEIKARGYADELLDYLERVQDEVYKEQTANGETPSGLWAYEPTWSLAQSIQKYVTFFNDEKYGRPIKYCKEAIATCIEIMIIDANGEKGLNDLMNQWNTIGHIMSNVKKYNSDKPEVIKELYDMVRARGVELIECLEKNLDAHRLGDGMYLSYLGKSFATLYGVNVSKGVRESDVNGQLLVTTLYRSVFLAFDYPVVPLCTEEDGYNFVDIITNSYPIEKNPLEPEISFENTELSSITDLALSKVTDIGAVSIVDDPQGDNGTRVLSFVSGKGDGKGDTLRISVRNNAGNCNIIEFDLLFAESSGSGEALQLKIGEGLMLGIAKVGDYLKVQSLSDNGASPETHTLLSASDKLRADVWHRIRIEIYDPTGSETSPKVKFFVDNQCIDDASTVYFGSNVGTPYSSVCESVTLYSKASYETLLYLDNLYLSRESKYFEAGDDVSDMRGK
ncbi:MAG: hypothetical protein IJW03_04980 [Clostridia bacterium]|nr:hypothetical protein [Clostridia bacterium]